MDGRNWYTYCDNNPLGWVDDDGCKRKLLIIKGEVGGEYGLLIGLCWDLFFSIIESEYGDEYDITVLVRPTEDEAVDAIADADADAFIFYGHGSKGMCDLQGVDKGGKKGGVYQGLQAQDAGIILEKRDENGKGPLDFVEIWACEVFLDPLFPEEWQKVVDPQGHLLGFTEATFDPATGPGTPRVYPGTWKPPGGKYTKRKPFTKTVRGPGVVLKR